MLMTELARNLALHEHTKWAVAGWGGAGMWRRGRGDSGRGLPAGAGLPGPRSTSPQLAAAGCSHHVLSPRGAGGDASRPGREPERRGGLQVPARVGSAGRGGLGPLPPARRGAAPLGSRAPSSGGPERAGGDGAQGGCATEGSCDSG